MKSRSRQLLAWCALCAAVNSWVWWRWASGADWFWVFSGLAALQLGLGVRAAMLGVRAQRSEGGGRAVVVFSALGAVGALIGWALGIWLAALGAA